MTPMTSPGQPSPATPLAGLVELALAAPVFTGLTETAAAGPARLDLVGPASARPFVAAALARATPLLVVTATGREADDLTAELRAVLGDAAALFPIGRASCRGRVELADGAAAIDNNCKRKTLREVGAVV